MILRANVYIHIWITANRTQIEDSYQETTWPCVR